MLSMRPAVYEAVDYVYTSNRNKRRMRVRDAGIKRTGELHPQIERRQKRCLGCFSPMSQDIFMLEKSQALLEGSNGKLENAQNWDMATPLEA